MIHGVPEFYRRAADAAVEHLEQAREQLLASQKVIDEVDALLAEIDVLSVS